METVLLVRCCIIEIWNWVFGVALLSPIHGSRVKVLFGLHQISLVVDNIFSNRYRVIFAYN